MIKKFLFTCIVILCIVPLTAQNITEAVYESYENYKEKSLDNRRIKHHQLQPLIDNYRGNSKFLVNKVGESIQQRDLNLITIGKGPTNIFLWSQMHGDEPTATQAIFDLLNFFDSDDFEVEKKSILDNLTLHFLPMLNPDGAEVFQRRNALGIDINRDALRLQSPEGRTLKRVRDSLDATFGFNLHDQSTYYNAERTEKPASISYLATAYNYEKDINEVRASAMKVIVFMNDIIQKYAPGQVGRYNDDFEPRAFGDNIAKWGTSLILIESGGYANDVEKQEIRKLNYVSILSALYTIANKSYLDIPIELLEDGIAYVKSTLPSKGFSTDKPVHIVGDKFRLNNFKLTPGQNPTFFLEKNGKRTHAVINGFILDLEKSLEKQQFGNALIYRD